MKLINHVLDIRRLIQQAFDNRFSRMGLRRFQQSTKRSAGNWMN